MFGIRNKYSLCKINEIKNTQTLCPFKEIVFLSNLQ